MPLYTYIYRGIDIFLGILHSHALQKACRLGVPINSIYLSTLFECLRALSRDRQPHPWNGSQPIHHGYYLAMRHVGISINHDCRGITCRQ